MILICIWGQVHMWQVHTLSKHFKCSQGLAFGLILMTGIAIANKRTLMLLLWISQCTLESVLHVSLHFVASVACIARSSQWQMQVVLGDAARSERPPIP
eukprot:2500382-Amphidinium_carterae.2